MKTNKTKIRLWAVVFWLLVWEAASLIIDQKLFLVSPVTVFLRLTQLAVRADFWAAIVYSFVRIFGGFLLALLSGIVLAVLSAESRRAEELLAPLMAAVKSVPVASFIILVLLFFPSRYLSVIISFLMVFPMIYTNVMEGIRNTDRKLKEMAGLFGLSRTARLRYLYVPQVYPYLSAACEAATGFAFKSGIAAEVIGMPKGSVGERLQQAKVYLNTPDLLAWTVVIVVISLIGGKGFLALLLGLEKIIRTPSAAGAARQKRDRRTEKSHRDHYRDSGDEEKSGIHVSGLKKSYGDKTVLDGFSCDIPEGGSTALMGTSGSGKTTLFRLLAGLEKADAGTITGLAGKKISAVFQEDRLFSYMSAEQNISLAGADRDWIQEALAACGLPEGSQPVSEFSGGMRRRVSIIRAIVADADVLFLDEPFKGLDEKTREQVIAWLLKETDGKTKILITHEPEEVRLMQCKQTISLQQGRRTGR